MQKPPAKRVAKKVPTKTGGGRVEKSSGMDDSTVRPIFNAPAEPPRPPAKKSAAKKADK